ncbi:MAG: MerR family DNA-binding transcriptional regulator [Actinomycetota bacterium]|nr:MerR family DNA-binding transcriptional regulator [Actinomycetota bacterium]
MLTAGEVARAFGVNPRTVRTWANKGWLPVVRTLGGHRRFRLTDVRALMRDKQGAP